MEACAVGSKGLVKLLHDAGAKWFPRSAKGLQALQFAQAGGFEVPLSDSLFRV